MTEDQIKNAITGCDGVIVGVDPLNANVLINAPNLKAIAKYGVGLDNIDIISKTHTLTDSKRNGDSSTLSEYF